MKIEDQKQELHLSARSSPVGGGHMPKIDVAALEGQKPPIDKKEREKDQRTKNNEYNYEPFNPLYHLNKETQSVNVAKQTSDMHSKYSKNA